MHFTWLPRACITSKVRLQICIHGCKFAPTPKVMVLHVLCTCIQSWSTCPHWLHALPHNWTFYYPGDEAFVNIVGKGENAGIQCFLWKTNSVFWVPFVFCRIYALIRTLIFFVQHRVKKKKKKKWWLCSVDNLYNISGSVFTNHFQEHSLSLSPRFANLNVTQLLIG